MFDKNDGRLRLTAARSIGDSRIGRTTGGNNLQSVNGSFPARNGKGTLRGEIIEASPEEIGRGAAAALLPRLPASRLEAEAIAALVPASERKIALGFETNKTAATSAEMGRYRYLHFATHGLLNIENPLLSSIALSAVSRRGEEQGGFLRAMEIFDLKLSAEMVVLSGCSTGLGREITGEGLIGLVHPFLNAGAKRVVTTWWGVDDLSAAEFMTRFYRDLLVKKQRPAAALRSAQITMWKTAQWRAPFYWAAFALQGEPR